MNGEKIAKELQERIHKACELVQQFDDGELSYQGLDNELYNLYAAMPDDEHQPDTI